MEVVFTQQTKDNCIPSGQVCQAFDSMMTLDFKSRDAGVSHANPYCVAPAYYYVFGINGERFLCDFHFHLEQRGPLGSTTHHKRSEYISYVYSNAESILETFGEPPADPKPDVDCYCGKEALVFFGAKSYCNFHFRKHYYRMEANGHDISKALETIKDYRRNYITSIEDDYSLESLKVV